MLNQTRICSSSSHHNHFVRSLHAQGLRLSDKQRLNVWDLLEGHKIPAPLSWAWVGAVKMERRPLAYEETHLLLKYHTHSLVKPSSYYYEPLPLPPEDLEPLMPAEKQVVSQRRRWIWCFISLNNI